MSALDWIILSLSLLGHIGIVRWGVKRKTEDASDYFLSGRRKTCLAIFTVNKGSEHLVGLAV